MPSNIKSAAALKISQNNIKKVSSHGFFSVCFSSYEGIDIHQIICNKRKRTRNTSDHVIIRIPVMKANIISHNFKCSCIIHYIMMESDFQTKVTPYSE